MKLTIDTKEDSHQDIKKIIKMLQHLVGEGSHSNISNQGNIFDDPSPSLSNSYEEPPSSEPETQPTNAFSAMFGDNAPTQTNNEEKEEISTYGDYNNKEKLNLDEEIVPY